jgi:hypothetical protein
MESECEFKNIILPSTTYPTAPITSAAGKTMNLQVQEKGEFSKLRHKTVLTHLAFDLINAYATGHIL